MLELVALGGSDEVTEPAELGLGGVSGLDGPGQGGLLGLVEQRMTAHPSQIDADRVAPLGQGAVDGGAHWGISAMSQE